MRQLENENRRLKALVADLSLEKHTPSEALRKLGARPARRRELVAWAQATFRVSVVRACALAQFIRVAQRTPSRPKDQTALRSRFG